MDYLKDHNLLVDEVDMPAHVKNGFRGASGLMKARFFYGSAAAPLTQLEHEAYGSE